MFRSSTNIMELALNLAKCYIYIKTFGENYVVIYYYVVVWQHVYNREGIFSK